MYDAIQKVVRESGLWYGVGSTQRQFLLSPSIYEITDARRRELDALGTALMDCLSGFGRILAIAEQPRLTNNRAWGMIARALRAGVPASYHKLQILHPSAAPGICKVDLMETMDGTYRIAEIDGHNKHGLGYSTLARRIRLAVAPASSGFPGIATLVAEEMRRRGKTSVTLLCADQERFYLPEFEILRAELARYGITMTVIQESAVKIVASGMQVNGASVEDNVFVDLPFLHHNHALEEHLMARYQSGDAEFLIPPKPFLSSKVVMGILRNDEQNADVEAILRSQIPGTSLELLRRYVPQTRLVHARIREEEWIRYCVDKRLVLKEVISSGMKGTSFSEDPVFASALRRAARAYYHFVLQEEVINNPKTFLYFDETGKAQSDTWYMRVTVHYVMRQTADVTVTARRDKRVHGARDCLQIGTAVVSTL